MVVGRPVVGRLVVGRLVVGRLVVGRLLALILSLLAASLAVFAVVNLLPGDVAQVMLGQNAAPQDVAALRVKLGLDVPWPQRYFSWVGALLRGDLGRSVFTGDPVSLLIAPRVEVTFWLVGLGMLLACAVAFPLGLWSAMRRRHLDGFAVNAFSHLGMSVPAFLAGILAVIVFAVRLRWLPANGYVAWWQDPAEWARHLVLPVLSLAVVQSAVLTRYVRSAFIEVLAEDHLRTARAVGWTRLSAVLRHGVRSAALSIVTVLGLQLATLVVGAIVVERVFVMPGLGSLLLDAVSSRDLVVVQTVVMLLVVVVLAVNAIVDVAYLVLDPRLRTGAGR